MPMLQTEHEFTLPMGYVDGEGNLHRHGIMRLATAGDEILPLKDPRVRNNEAYLVVILLARVITRLGSLSVVNPQVIEGLFAKDFAFLQSVYNRINGYEPDPPRVCPHCRKEFEVPAPSGEFVATPANGSAGR